MIPYSMQSIHFVDVSDPATVHVLGGCPVALSQDCFTYWHSQVLHCLALRLSDFLSRLNTIHAYADLLGMQASESPQGTIPSSLIINPNRSDIVIHDEICNSVALLELTCSLDSTYHLESVIDQEEYNQLSSEFNRLGVPCHYKTVNLSVLGHYL